MIGEFSSPEARLDRQQRGCDMGNFYVNFSVKSGNRDLIVASLQEAGRVAYILPSDGNYIVVCEEEADTQATDSILAVGGLLSQELAVPVVAVLNHDDDLLY